MSEKEEELEPSNIPIEELDVKDINDYDERLDSGEEFYFTHYLLELKKAGVILDADKNITSIVIGEPIKHIYTQILQRKTKIKIQHLAKGFEYTPDFNCKWSHDWKDIIFAKINQGKKNKDQKVPFISFNNIINGTTFEVKGDYTKPGQLHSTNMKIVWLYERHQCFVQMVKIPKLFKDTFTPQKYIDDMVRKTNTTYGKKGQSRLKYKPVFINDYLAKLKESAKGQTLIL